MVNINYKIIGWLGTILFSIRMFPQIMHTYYSKHVSGLSLNFILMDMISAFLLMIYSLKINAYPMIVCNFIATLCDIILLVIFFKKKE